MHNDPDHGVGETKPKTENKDQRSFKLVTIFTSPHGQLVLVFVTLLLAPLMDHFASNPRILYLPLAGFCLLVFYIGHCYIDSQISHQEAKPAQGATVEKDEKPTRTPDPSPTVTPAMPAPTRPSAESEPSQAKSAAPKSRLPESETKKEQSLATRPLAPLSDGQRFVLQKRLAELSGASVRLVRVGNEPDTGIVFEQLHDAFEKSEWTVQSLMVGMVSIVGANFPARSYLTGPNISASILEQVFSIFASIAVDLPLTPNAYTGGSLRSLPIPDVVIVIR